MVFVEHSGYSHISVAKSSGRPAEFKVQPLSFDMNGGRDPHSYKSSGKLEEEGVLESYGAGFEHVGTTRLGKCGVPGVKDAIVGCPHAKKCPSTLKKSGEVETCGPCSND